jgi:hypothetical protein
MLSTAAAIGIRPFRWTIAMLGILPYFSTEPVGSGRFVQDYGHELASLVHVADQNGAISMVVVSMVAEMNRYLKGGASVEFAFIMTIVSCTVLLTPWFVTMVMLLVFVWLCPSPTVKTRQRYHPARSATVLRFPVEKQTVKHNHRNAA